MRKQRSLSLKFFPAGISMLAVCLVAAMPAAANGTKAATTRDDVRAALAGLEQRWEAARQKLGVPGIAVAVVDADGIVMQTTLGLRDVERELPVTQNTMFYIASITKTYVATAVAQLAERGKIDLDSKVIEHLPRFKLPDDELTQAVTVRDLLCHRRGINSTPAVMLDAYTGEITEDRYYYWLERGQARDRVSYTNVHFTLAGRVVEAASKKPWRDYLREEIFAPLGMHRTTGYADTMYADEDVSFPYVIEGGRPVLAPWKTDRTMHAAGGLGTSIHDATIWLRTQLGHGAVDGKRFLSDETMSEILRDQSQSEVPSGSIRVRKGFGLGWMTGTYRGHRYLEHGGGYNGASAHFSFLPKQGYGVAILVNASGAGQALGDVACIDIYDRLLGLEPEDLLPGTIRRMESDHAASDVDSSRINTDAQSEFINGRRWEGEYTNEHWGRIVIERDDSGVKVHLGDLPTRLVPERRGRFALDRPGGAFARGRILEESGDDNPQVDAVLVEFGRFRARFDRK